MVNLTRIYTRTGDQGDTRLSDNSVARKTDLRVQAYGDVDEANSQLGVVLSCPDLPTGVAEVLRLVQNELFDVGADLSNPLQPSPEWEPLRILESSVERLEHWCDQFGEPLPNLRSFVLPGGGAAAAHLHVARTIVRRAERSAWRAAEVHGLDVVAGDQEGEADDTAVREGGVNSMAIRYLNRLSDLLFILARSVTTRSGEDPEAEVLWVPGGERHSTPG